MPRLQESLTAATYVPMRGLSFSPSQQERSEVTEIWRAVPGCPWHEISDRARIRTIPHIVMRSNNSPYTVKERLLRISIDRRNGARFIVLATGIRGRYRTIYPRRLAAELFGDEHREAA
jgi:hypothetical protein